MASTSVASNAELQHMTKDQLEAVVVLIRSVHMAQGRGAYTLTEAKMVADACDKLITTPQPDATSST